jgi:multiple sugar transport system permease protein
MATLTGAPEPTALRRLTAARPSPAGSERPTVGNRALRALGYFALTVAAAAVLLPFFWMVMSSLKGSNDIFTVPIRWLPEVWRWDNYVEIWRSSGIATWWKNTILLSTVVTFLQVLTGSFAAYGFSRMRFPGRDVLFLTYIGTIAVPWQSYMIPQFILFSKLHVTNTLWSIILLQAFGAFGVFLMKQFFDSIPEELSEAARIDGLSEYSIWARIMLPLSMPAIASLTLLTFVNTWNDYMGPLLYLRDNSLWTLQLGLRNFITSLYDANYALLFTGLTLSVVPIALIFLLGQRYFVEGIATSGLKG